MARERCRACGVDLIEGEFYTGESLDGLCSDAPPRGNACYSWFVDFGYSRGLDIRKAVGNPYASYVDWSQAAVNVLFDAWLELGRPQVKLTPAEILLF